MKTKKIILAIGIVAVCVVLGILTFVPVQVYRLPYSEYKKMVSLGPKSRSIEVDPIQAATSDTFVVRLHPHIKFKILNNEVFYYKNRSLIDEDFVHTVKTLKGVVCDSTAEGFEFKKFTYDITDFFEFRSETIDPFLYEAFLHGIVIEIADKYVIGYVTDAYKYILREYPSDSLMNREIIKEINTKVTTLVNEKLKNKSIKISAIMLTISGFYSINVKLFMEANLFTGWPLFFLITYPLG